MMDREWQPRRWPTRYKLVGLILCMLAGATNAHKRRVDRIPEGQVISPDPVVCLVKELNI